MNGMLFCCIFFAVGVILIIKGGDLFVDGAGGIARAMRIPSFIIGATVVSLATTMPEMIVSLMAALGGKNDMAIGNAVGSVTCNTGLILGIAMTAMSVNCPRKKYMRQCVLLIAATVVLFFSSLSGTLSAVGSVVLAAIFALFMAENIRSAKRAAECEGGTEERSVLSSRDILYFLSGAVGIVVGSRFMVEYGSEIALLFGVSERIISLTLVAVGTSLPELVTTLTAIAKKEYALSVGNIVGANVIDTALILPVCSLVSGERIPVSQGSIFFDIPVCIATVCLALVPMLVREKASKLLGVLLLLSYAVYTAFVVGAA